MQSAVRPSEAPSMEAADGVLAVIQVAGAALIGVAESAKAQQKSSPVTPKQANDILLAGLACQCFSFSTFLLILCGAIYRASRPGFPGPDAAAASKGTGAYKQLRLMMWVILITSDLILLRTVFRLAETGQGESAPLSLSATRTGMRSRRLIQPAGFFGFASTHEWLFAILEYLPVIAALIIWAAFPPSRFLERAEMQHAAQVVEEEKRTGPAQPSDMPREEAVGSV